MATDIDPNSKGGSHPLSQIKNGKDWLHFEFSARKAKNRNYSLRAFAKLLELSPGHASDLMNGRQQITKSTIEKLCKISIIPFSEKTTLATVLQSSAIRTKVLSCGVPPLWHVNAVNRNEFSGWLSTRMKHGARVALFGPIGSGKTFEIRRWLASSSFCDCFCDGVVWFDLGSSESNFERLGVVCEALGIPTLRRDLKSTEDRRRTLAARLAGSRILFVYDHVNAFDQIIELELGGLHSASILLSRSPEVATRFAPEESYKLAYFSRREAMECVSLLAPEIPSRFQPRIEGILHSIDFCPTLVSLFAFYWKRRFQEKAEWRLERAVEETERTVLPFSDPDNRPPNLTLEVQSKLLLRSEELSGEQRSVLEELISFSPSPASFSKEAACAVGNCALRMIDSLVDAGYLFCQENGRLSLPTGVRHALCDVRPSEESKRRFLAFFLAHIDNPRLEMSYVIEERKNLLTTVALAIEQKNLADALTLARTVFLKMRAFQGEDWEVASLEKIEAMLQERSDPRDLVDFLNVKGHSLAARWFDTLSRETFERAYEQAKLCDYRAGELEALVGICNKILDFNQRAPWVKLIENELSSIPEGILRFRALRLLGRQYANTGQFKVALTFFAEALQISESIGAKEECVDAMDCIASTYFFLGNFAEAFALLDKTVDLAQQIGDLDGVAKLRIRIASALLQMGNRLQAIPICHEGLLIAEQQALSGLEGRAMFLLADSYFHTNQLDLALDFSERGRKKAADLGSPYLQCEFSAVLFQVLCRLGRESEAESYLQEGLEASKQSFDYHRSMLLMTRLDWLLEIERWDRLHVLYWELDKEFRDHAADFLSTEFYCTGVHLAVWQRNASLAAELLNKAQTGDEADRMAIAGANLDWASAKLFWLRGDREQAKTAASKALAYFESQNDRRAKPIERWFRTNELL